MKKVSNQSSIKILVFNPLKRLVGIFQSTRAAAITLGATTQSIHYACTGVTISARNLYFRHLSDEIEVTLDDLGTLRLEEYDQLCGVERKYYKTKNMSRVGMKYNMKHGSTSSKTPTSKSQNNED